MCFTQTAEMVTGIYSRWKYLSTLYITQWSHSTLSLWYTGKITGTLSTSKSSCSSACWLWNFMRPRTAPSKIMAFPFIHKYPWDTITLILSLASSHWQNTSLLIIDKFIPRAILILHWIPVFAIICTSSYSYGLSSGLCYTLQLYSKFEVSIEILPTL